MTTPEYRTVEPMSEDGWRYELATTGTPLHGVRRQSFTVRRQSL